MMLLYVLIGLAVLYTAYLFGRGKRMNVTVQPAQNNSHQQNNTPQTAHKNHGGGCC